MNLPKAQQRVIDIITEHGSICRYPGGYWNAPEMDNYKDGYEGTKAVNACLRKGLIKVVEEKEYRNGKYAVKCALASIHATNEAFGLASVVKMAKAELKNAGPKSPKDGAWKQELKMTKREYFAAKALQGLMVRAIPGRHNSNEENWNKERAKFAVDMAEALIKALVNER